MHVRRATALAGSALTLVAALSSPPAWADGRTHCVVVQPIVLRSDEGTEPAACRLPERLIDRVYARAGIDIHFLDPIYYDNTSARDGKENVDAIVQNAAAAGVFRSPDWLINMFFVNARSEVPAADPHVRRGSGVAFVVQGPDDTEAKGAFAVAHGSGRALGLTDAAEDPDVPEGVANLMGGGPFEERVGANGLVDHQIGVIRRSRWVRPRFECLDRKPARSWITDESFEPYFALLRRREIGALTGRAVEGTLEECREIARDRFREAVLSFTDVERLALKWVYTRVTRRLEDDFPLVVFQPWRFIKVANQLCGGFSHTRGLCIIFSQRTVDRIVKLHREGDEERALRSVGTLFVHEQTHVLQRCYPKRFTALYEGLFQLVRADVESIEALEENRIGNPDAPRLEWIVSRQDESGNELWFWPRTILRGDSPVPVMGKDFKNVAVLLRRDHRQRFVVALSDEGAAVTEPLDFSTHFGARFATAGGLDHPNEIAAYTFGKLFRDAYADGDPPDDLAPKLTEFRRWGLENLLTFGMRRARF